MKINWNKFDICVGRFATVLLSVLLVILIWGVIWSS